MTPEEQKVIEEVIGYCKSSLNLNMIELKLRALLPPEPERIGGLTIPEWQQLAKLGDVLVEIECKNLTDQTTQVGRYLRDIDTKKHGCMFRVHEYGSTSKTQKGSSWRYQCRLIEDDRWRLNEGKQPVPDGVRVEIVRGDGLLVRKLAKRSVWDNQTNEKAKIIAYRIIGVGE